MHVNNKPGYKRSDWYYRATRLEYRRDNIFSQTDNVKHQKRRKQMAQGYSGRGNTRLEGSIDERVQGLLNLIRSKYISSDRHVVPMDLTKKVPVALSVFGIPAFQTRNQSAREVLSPKMGSASVE
ncbi:hypothetical protein VN97_g9598 [Penicillium thymicola]|uniref:Uncharacterized protein n=1 Tax=Penicillium thymicola TaxID=293382 RepID=A0AAI9TC18_PENTH|nr:hypothetical protein VN97_g9598 [Penicillium thymicola]